MPNYGCAAGPNIGHWLQSLRAFSFYFKLESLPTADFYLPHLFKAFGIFANGLKLN